MAAAACEFRIGLMLRCVPQSVTAGTITRGARQ